MAKRARPKPFDESRLRANEFTSKTYVGTIPEQVCRGLVRGLLEYFSMPERREILGKVFHAVIEDALIGEADRLQDMDSAIVSDHVPNVIKNLATHPSYDVLAEECTRLLPVLKGYSSLKGQLSRATWLKSNLPKILTSLFEASRCPLLQASPEEPFLCHRRTNMPSDREISSWAEKRKGELDVAFCILAHHHGSSYDIVRERYKRPEGRRSPSNKGPLPPKRKRLRTLIAQKKKDSKPRIFYSYRNAPRRGKRQ